MPFVYRTTMQQSQPSQTIYSKQGKNRKTFLNLMHCIANLTQIVFFCTGKRQKLVGGGGGVGRKHCCTVWQETKLKHVFSVKTDSLHCNSFPGSIQCERISFLPSFESSVDKKKISHHRKEFLSLRDRCPRSEERRLYSQVMF